MSEGASELNLKHVTVEMKYASTNPVCVHVCGMVTVYFLPAIPK